MRGRGELSLRGQEGNLAQTRVAALFPVALLVLLGGIHFTANHWEPFQLPSCSLKLFPSLGR